MSVGERWRDMFKLLQCNDYTKKKEEISNFNFDNVLTAYYIPKIQKPIELNKLKQILKIPFFLTLIK